jgi:hypothetical protein
MIGATQKAIKPITGEKQLIFDWRKERDPYLEYFGIH